MREVQVCRDHGSAAIHDSASVVDYKPHSCRSHHSVVSMLPSCGVALIFQTAH